MTAALLHDVVDDTSVGPAEVEATFGAHVAGLVATVTQLSQMNQLMRRKHREAARKAGATADSRVRSPRQSQPAGRNCMRTDAVPRWWSS